MIRRAALGLLVVPAAVAAGTTELEAFDFEHCVAWHFTDDVGVGYTASVELQTRAQADGKAVFHATAVNRNGIEPQYGFCELIAADAHWDAFSCSVGSSRFPLLNRRFQFTGARNSLPSFRCVGNCAALSIRTLHLLGSGEVENVGYAKERDHFSRVCKGRQGVVAPN